jgi:hypothetical protein
LNNWWEEVAWAGFVGPRLQQRYDSTFRASLIAGPLFALQHVSLVVHAGLVGGLVLLAVLAAVCRPALLLGADVTVGVCHAIAHTPVSNGLADGPTIPGLLSPAAGIVVQLTFSVVLLLVALKAWAVLALWALFAVLAPLALAASAVPKLEGVAGRVGQLGLGAAVGLVGMVTVLTVGQPVFTTWGNAVPLGQVALKLALLTLAWKVPDLLLRQSSASGINLLLLWRLLRK